MCLRGRVCSRWRCSGSRRLLRRCRSGSSRGRSRQDSGSGVVEQRWDGLVSLSFLIGWLGCGVVVAWLGDVAAQLTDGLLEIDNITAIPHVEPQVAVRAIDYVHKRIAEPVMWMIAAPAPAWSTRHAHNWSVFNVFNRVVVGLTGGGMVVRLAEWEHRFFKSLE